MKPMKNRTKSKDSTNELTALSAMNFVSPLVEMTEWEELVRAPRINSAFKQRKVSFQTPSSLFSNLIITFLNLFLLVFHLNTHLR